jgi:hypothetical protein
MAFDTTPDCSDVLKRLKELAKGSKNYLTSQRALMVAANCDAQIPLSVIQHLGQVNALMTAQVALVGASPLTAYARQVTGSSTYDPAAEFTNTKNAMASAQTTLTNMFPKDGSNFILYQTIQADGTLLNRTFTSAQLAAAVSTIDSVIATIS